LVGIVVCITCILLTIIRLFTFLFCHCIVCTLIHVFKLPTGYLLTFSFYFDMVVFSLRVSVSVMRFNVTFNNSSARSWWSVILVEETELHGENHKPPTSHWQSLSHNVVSHTSHLSRIRTHMVSCDWHWLHR
jgi:hypothetical protein